MEGSTLWKWLGMKRSNLGQVFSMPFPLDKLKNAAISPQSGGTFGCLSAPLAALVQVPFSAKLPSFIAQIIAQKDCTKWLLALCFLQLSGQ
jgi:hypothetical protein